MSRSDYTQRTSTKDLYNIAADLSIPLKVIRKRELPKVLRSGYRGGIIMNLDDVGGGSHWVAVYPPKRMYFDSYARSAPTAVPRGFTVASQKKELQSIESTDCGALCALWLYYMMHRSNSEYYKLFKDVYK